MYPRTFSYRTPHLKNIHYILFHKLNVVKQCIHYLSVTQTLLRYTQSEDLQQKSCSFGLEDKKKSER